MSLKRPAIPADWEQLQEGSRRRRHYQHISQMESDEYGELCPAQCLMCQTHNVQCRRYKPGVCDSVTACSFCKARSVSCSHSSKSEAPKSNRRTSVSTSATLSNAPETPGPLPLQQYPPMPSPRGTPSANQPSAPPSSLFTTSIPTSHVAPSSASQVLDTCVNRLLELQRRMLQFGIDLKSPTPDMDALRKEQRSQSAEIAALTALILAERAN